MYQRTIAKESLHRAEKTYRTWFEHCKIIGMCRKCDCNISLFGMVGSEVF